MLPVSLHQVDFTACEFARTTLTTDNTIRLWQVDTEEALETLRSDRPYGGMNITAAKGSTLAQEEALIALGAKQDSQ